MAQFSSSILVVDDDKISLEISTTILELLDIKADKANSGTKAVELCAAKHYDVIFMDIEMPNLNGYQTTEIIKKMNHTSANAIIVALSAALSNKAKVMQCIQAGMKDCMTKPLNAEDVKVRFKKWKVK